MAEPKAKRAKTDKEDVADVISEKEMKSLEQVQEIQEKLTKINEEEEKELMKLRRTYWARKRPHFDKRQVAIEDIADFWLKTLLAHPATREFISGADQQALSYLSKIDVVPLTKPDDNADAEELYRVIFAFRQNPFFTNKELWRIFPPSEEGNVSETVSMIGWKDTDEANELKKTVLAAHDDENGEHTSFFAMFEMHDLEDDEFMQHVADEIFANPWDLFMNNDFDEEGEDDDDDDDDDDDAGLDGGGQEEGGEEEEG